ncbi:MAG: hypothetical protein ACJA1A_003901, partial [Saprospiraceae bacterium]
NSTGKTEQKVETRSTININVPYISIITSHKCQQTTIHNEQNCFIKALSK